MEPQGIGVHAESSSPKASTVLPALSAYFVSVGALYLWGYWGRFDINVMEHLGLSDIVKAAAWPVLSWFLFLVAGMFLGESIKFEGLAVADGRKTSLGQTLWRLRGAIKWIYIVFIAGLLAFGGAWAWQPASVLLALVLGPALSRMRQLQNLIPSDGPRGIMAFAAVILPMWSFGQGQINANSIRDGRSYQFVLPESDGVVGSADASTSLRYLGLAGNAFFFWDPTALSVNMVPSGSVKVLKLKAKPALNAEPKPAVGTGSK